MEVGFCSLANLSLLLVAIMINLSSNNASAASHFQNETDRLALIELKHRISDDPDGLLNSWNDTLHFCEWPGITCNVRHQRVTAINLRGKSLLGSLSPHIGNLSFLKSVELQDNKFHGEIPQEIGRLFRVRHLNLSFNTLSGEIPLNLSLCTELRNLSVGENNLIGKIPVELGSLLKLVFLNFNRNNLTGVIPQSFLNLSSLQILYLTENNLDGTLPNEIGLLTRLFELGLDVNNLTGTIPPSLYNISTLTIIGLAQNFLSGNLPADIGLRLPNVQRIYVAGNLFHGSLPISIANASTLEVLDLPFNSFEGKVPTNLGNLPNLQLLNLESNLFGQNSIEDLDFLQSLMNCSNLITLSFYGNNMGGNLPNIIGNLSFQLQKLFLGSNKITGAIPVGLGNLRNLYLLSMGGNYFSGPIPSDFAKLKNLEGLYMADNLLSGQLPSSLCNITFLFKLKLDGNSLDGTIPASLGSCGNLKELNLSQNKFTGVISPLVFGMTSLRVLDLSYNSLSSSLPLEVGRLANINQFNVSNNNLSGEIPGTFGDCSSLEYLDMEGNLFTGTIPQKLASLKGIQHLDLSQNNLTGEIPEDFERLTFLKYLNLSFNNLEGELQTNGVFADASQIILYGNSKLCGGITELQLPRCLIHKKKNVKLLVVVVTCVVIAVILISALILFYLRKKVSRNVSSTTASGVDKLLRVSYHELQRATDGFSPVNLIGSGNFGFVYRGRLDQCGEKLVAIKVLDLQKNGACKSFKAECRALRNIRHRNLVALLTYCSSIDFRGHEFKALVYAYMENGSLDMWLHPQEAEGTRSRNLNLLQRLNIAIDVASALDYLHDHCEVAIVHCDLKPSNVLLSNDLTAHVGDFGLAKLLHPTTQISFDQGSSSTVVRGTIGYAAPEYGMGHEASTEGDIYSYGILLLEMFTGRSPTDGIFVDGLDLHNYVKSTFPENVMKVVDLSLVSGEVKENRQVESNDVKLQIEETFGKYENLSGGKENWLKCLVSIFEIGLKCSAVSPKDRKKMNEIIKELHHIKDAFFSAKRNKAVRPM